MKKLQCKDIPDLPILQFLVRLESSAEQRHRRGTAFDGYPNSVDAAMPGGVNDNLVLAKMNGLIRRKLVSGCACGCRGDFGITDKGRELLAQGKPDPAADP